MRIFRKKHDEAYLASEGWRLEVESKLAKAIELYYSELYDEAQTLTESLLSKDPSNINIFILLERIYHAKEDYEQAKTFADKAHQMLNVEEHAQQVEAHVQVSYALADSYLSLDQDPPDSIATSMETIWELNQNQGIEFMRTKIGVGRHFAHEYDEVYNLYSPQAQQYVKQLIQSNCSNWHNELDSKGHRSALSTAWYMVNEKYGFSVFMGVAMGIMIVLNTYITLINLFVTSVVIMIFTSFFVFVFEYLYWQRQHARMIEILIQSPESEPFFMPKFKKSPINWLLYALCLGATYMASKALYPHILWIYDNIAPHLQDLKVMLKDLLKGLFNR